MTQNYSISRQKAEAAFNNIQTPVFTKGEGMLELESAAQSRDAKTLRLREARLAKELEDRTSATSALLAKRKAAPSKKT